MWYDFPDIKCMMGPISVGQAVELSIEEVFLKVQIYNSYKVCWVCSHLYCKQKRRPIFGQKWTRIGQIWPKFGSPPTRAPEKSIWVRMSPSIPIGDYGNIQDFVRGIVMGLICKIHLENHSFWYIPCPSWFGPDSDWVRAPWWPLPFGNPPLPCLLLRPPPLDDSVWKRKVKLSYHELKF